MNREFELDIGAEIGDLEDIKDVIASSRPSVT